MASKTACVGVNTKAISSSVEHKQWFVSGGIIQIKKKNLPFIEDNLYLQNPRHKVKPHYPSVYIRGLVSR